MLALAEKKAKLEAKKQKKEESSSLSNENSLQAPLIDDKDFLSPPNDMSPRESPNSWSDKANLHSDINNNNFNDDFTDSKKSQKIEDYFSVPPSTFSHLELESTLDEPLLNNVQTNEDFFEAGDSGGESVNEDNDSDFEFEDTG